MSIGVQRFGDYHVGRRLGVGGMAEVYVAERRGPRGFRREVALKVLRPHLRDAPGVAERFTREARLAAGLRHPNVVPVIDFGIEAGVAYLAMDLVDGPDLRRATLAGVRGGRLLPARLAVHVAIQVARGLAYAHRRTDDEGRPLGLVHRDVSPQNVLLSRNGEVRLTDFGIATAALAAEDSASGTLCGKLAYLAPEQVDGAAPDARADVFALGVVLWELLARRRLFLAPTDAETLARVRRCEVPVPPEPAAPEVPAAVWVALGRALARDPGAREPGADGFAAALVAAWPESDRGEAATELAAWLADVAPFGAAAQRAQAAAVPGGDSLSSLAARPAPDLTPTLATDPNATRRDAPVRAHVRRLVGAAALLAAAGVAATAVVSGLAPAGREDGPVGPPAAPAAGERAGAPGDGAGTRPAPASEPSALRGPVPEAPARAAPTAPASGSTRRTPPPRSASLIVTSRPAGAVIEVDGRPAGRTPRRLDGLEPDRPLLVVLRLDGHRAAERSVTPSAAGAATVDVALEPAFGLLSLDADPWAEVSIDGAPVGLTPVYRRSVPAGRRHVRFVHPPSGRAEEVVVQVDPDGEVRRRIVLAPRTGGAAAPAAGAAR